jgi:predicted Ser/Thr protein kinase
MKDEQSGTPDGAGRTPPADPDAAVTAPDDATAAAPDIATDASGKAKDPSGSSTAASDKTPDVSRDATAAPAPAPAAMVCVVCSAGYGADMRFCPLDGSILRPANDGRSELIGAVIDERYYLTKKLGHGGMGDVYLGEHVRTQRLCAVKVVARMQARDPEALGRFLREATNAGRISHHNVATVYDFGETADGLVYLAMEYVDGEPLSRILEREGALPPIRAVEIARQVAEGVSAAHELGIVHRDLKPGNILIAQDRRGGDLVKVVDFGIARAPADEQQNLTRTGIIIGTPEYMSPEQLIGDPVDGRSDIYSLGCILYQMLTGEQAFGGVTAQVITRRLTEKPPRPRLKNPAIPKPLDDLIVTTLGRTPQERFQTMEAVRDALLMAPAQPPSTGPQRVVAWLGHQPQPGEATVADGTTGATGESLAVDPPVTQAGPAASPMTGIRSASVTPTAASDSGLFAVETPNAEHLAAADLPDADSDDTDKWQEDDGEGLRALPLRKMAIGAGAVVLLVLVIAQVSGDRNGDAAAGAIVEDTTTTIVEPEPILPLEPDTAVLAGIWSQLALAEEQDFGDRFDEAFLTLHAADSSVATVLAAFPGNVQVQLLADSVRSQIEATLGRCTSLRDVNLARNVAAHECPVIE